MQSPKNSFKINNKKLTNQTSLLSFNSSHLSSSNDVETASISSSLSQKSEQQTNPQQQQNNITNHHHLNQSKSVVEEKMEDPEYKAVKTTAANQNRSLVRQSTDLTSSFPLKPFQKINSETVEIPGLNVKVVRYRIENDLGKLEPHLYKNYNSGGGDNTQMVSKGKIWFSLHYNEEIQSLSVTINRSEIFNGSQSPNGSLSYSNSASLNANTSVSAPNSPNLNKPDTYVRVQLLPDKKKKYQTRIQRKTCTPLFEETFYFQVPFNELVTKTLYLAQLEFGRFSKHELIGAVRLADLNTIKDLTTGDIEFIRNLTPLANVSQKLI